MRRALLPPIVVFAVLAVCASEVHGQVSRVPKSRNTKLSSQLRQLAEAPSTANLAAVLPGLVRDNGRIAITIRVGEEAASVDADLRRLGGRVAHRRGNVIEAYVPISSLQALSANPRIVRVDPVVPPQPLVTSQGVSVHNATLWHANSHSGSGVKVGIIDTGFTGYAALIGTELPAPAGVRCYSSVGSFSSNLVDCATSEHGTAVAETLVDVAPGAAVYIATPISLLDFRQSVEWMAAQGVKVINHSLGWTWTGPGNGTSPFEWSPQSTVDYAASVGILMVASAGNHQVATWTGGYSDTNGNLWHEFLPGDEVNNVYLQAGETIMVQARWDDYWGGAITDLDLYIVDAAGNLPPLAGSESPQLGSPYAVPFEFIAFTAPYAGTFGIAVHRYFESWGPHPAWIQVQTFTQQPLERWVYGYSIANPAESANAGLLAVGAAHWNSTATIAPYSSVGPTLDLRVKPDIVGVDGGNTVTYPTFNGTSQASPHVAGLAALVLQANPSFTPAQLASYLKTAALPRAGAAPNNTWGYGLAYLGTSPCQLTLGAPGRYFFSMGGAGSTAVGISAVCPWTATSNAPWIVLTSGSNGPGPKTLTYTVAANTGNARRSGTISVDGQTYTIRQAGVPVVTSTDDMNGDGRMDVLLQHANGSLAVWFMDDTFLIDGAMLDPSSVDPAWKIVGTGDVNADGKADIYWQHDAGNLAVWYMDGRTLVDGAQLDPPMAPAGWQVRAVADLSGDGKPDLILQHFDGRMAAWYMNGLQIFDGIYLTPVDPSWHVVGTGDVDQNGKLDLVLQNQIDGSLAVWFMDGTVLTDGAYIEPRRVDDQNWRVRGVGDLNGDGQPDLLWQHTATGNLAGWILHGTVLFDGTIFNPPNLGDPNWRIVGPR